MASLNDYKLVDIKSKKYFSLLPNQDRFEKLEEKQKCRLGFYLFILENYTGITDVSDLVDTITDTDFNKIVEKNISDDYGVDAVYIDEETKTIKLFNFKYRNNFKPGRCQDLNDTIISTKYINAVVSENIDNLKSKPLKHAKAIIKRLNSSEIWNLQLFIVSNECVEISIDNDHLKNLMEQYDLEVVTVGLPTIKDLLSNRPEPINATLLLERNAVMSYSEAELSSSMSYIARVSCSDIVRISCNKSALRDNYELDDLSLLSKVEPDYGVLFDNVRGFVLRSKFNPNIIRSLEEEPSKFFMFNNGLTIVASNIVTKPVNSNKMIKVSIKDFQILNGGQTLRSIHKFNMQDEKHILNGLHQAEVLVRIFMTESDSDTVNRIAEYTNSQNKISSSELKSLDSVQLDIENYLNEHDIIYSRKTGDTGVDADKDYKFKINMEKFGQLLMALSGHPEKSSNSKQHIFGKLYDELFSPTNFDISTSADIVERFEIIKSTYGESNYRGLDQKYYYILYAEKNTNYEISNLIDILEKHIDDYKVEKEMSEVRKLGQSRFKDELDILLNI